MYDFDFPLQEANDVLWSALRSCLVANGADSNHLPGMHIDRESEMVGVWTDPDLYLAQTCGYPYVTLLKEKGVRVVATPIYDAPLCESTGKEALHSLYRVCVCETDEKKIITTAAWSL